MSGISHLIDIIVYTALKDMKDEAIKKVIDALNKSFGGVLTDMKYVSPACLYDTRSDSLPTAMSPKLLSQSRVLLKTHGTQSNRTC
jgi:hypothetical protein